MTPEQHDRFAFLFVLSRSTPSPREEDSRKASVLGRCSSISNNEYEEDLDRIAKKAARRLTDIQEKMEGDNVHDYV